MCKISYVIDKEEDYDYLINAINFFMQNYKIDCDVPIVVKRNLMPQKENIILIKSKG